MTKARLRLMLLPGMDGTGELVREFAQALSERYAVTLVAYPTAEPMTYEEMEGFVVDQLPAEPYVLMAESYAAPIAIRVAAGTPSNLRGLVLCVGFATNPLQGWQRYFAKMFGGLMFYLPVPAFAAKRWFLGADAPASTVKRLQRVIGSVRAPVLAERLRSMLRCDVRADVRRIVVPTLQIVASEDHVIRRSCGDELERENANVETVAVRGPHGLLETQPERLAAIVVEFVERRCG